MKPDNLFAKTKPTPLDREEKAFLILWVIFEITAVWGSYHMWLVIAKIGEGSIVDWPFRIFAIGVVAIAFSFLAASLAAHLSELFK